MITVTHVDELDRRTMVEVPEGTSEANYGRGIFLGPPDLTSLALPQEVTTRLHNELYNRGIIRRSDAKMRRPEVHAALVAALRVDVERIITLYETEGNS